MGKSEPDRTSEPANWEPAKRHFQVMHKPPIVLPYHPPRPKEVCLSSRVPRPPTLHSLGEQMNASLWELHLQLGSRWPEESDFISTHFTNPFHLLVYGHTSVSDILL